MSLFTDIAPRAMRDLMKDFGLDKLGAAAILGNLGHESAGFASLQEIRPVGGGLGGYGWAQWTGPRRTLFLKYCSFSNLDPKSYEANYGYLRKELQTSESRAIPAVKAAPDLERKVIAFEAAFERAGLKNYLSRVAWANKALAAYALSLGEKAGGTAPKIPGAVHDAPGNASPRQGTPAVAVSPTPQTPPTTAGETSGGVGIVAGTAAVAGAAALAANGGLWWGWIAVGVVAAFIVGAILLVSRKK